MKLLAFVLLGFLAHSCSGLVQMGTSIFSNHLFSLLNKQFAENEGISRLGHTGILTSISNLANLDIIIIHQTNNLYGLEISGFVDFSSTGITGLRIDVHVLGQLSLTVTNDCLDIFLIEGSLQINLNVLNKAYFIGLGGGLGGLNLLDGFTSSAKLLLQAIIKEAIETALLSCNTGFQGITATVNNFGKLLNYHVTDITCTAQSVLVSLDLLIGEAGDTATKKISFATNEVKELAEGVICSIYASANLIGGFFDCVLDDVIPSIKKIIEATEWQLYKIYRDIKGNVFVSITKTANPSTSLTSSGGSFALSLGIHFSDGDNTFSNFETGMEIPFEVTENNGLLRLWISGASITWKRLGSQSDGCGCPDVNPLNILDDIIEVIIGDLVNTLTSVNLELPSLKPVIPYEQQKPADCFCTTDAYQCNSEY